MEQSERKTQTFGEWFKDWFGGVKWVEMLSAVGMYTLAAYVALTNTGTPPKTAVKLALAAIPASLWQYLRNPKAKGWEKDGQTSDSVEKGEANT